MYIELAYENNYLHLRVLQNSNICHLGDADTMIVSTILDHACNGDNIQLIAADTDLLIMVIYFWNSLMGQIIRRTETTKNYKAIECGIGVIAEYLGNVRKYLTFVHAFGRSNTTSAVYGQGKLSILKLLEKSKAARR